MKALEHKTHCETGSKTNSNLKYSKKEDTSDDWKEITEELVTDDPTES